MADNELDKSIEELEAEVLAELELDEANGQDAPKKGAVPAEKMDKAKGEVQDTGKAVVDPEQKDAPAKKVAAKAKEVGGQSPQKGEGKPDKMQKLAAQYEGYTDEEIRELCHSKDHDCATVVEHPVWGRGKPIHSSHAIPDDEGNVEWYDVQFKHGIEEKVMAEDMKIIVSEGHHEETAPKTKADIVSACLAMLIALSFKRPAVVKPTPTGIIRFAIGFKTFIPKPALFATSGYKSSIPASASTIASAKDLPSFKFFLTVTVKKVKDAGTEPKACNAFFPIHLAPFLGNLSGSTIFLPIFDSTPKPLDAIIPEAFDKKGAATAVVIGFLSTKFSSSSSTYCTPDVIILLADAYLLSLISST